jgi:hypothetical protein
MTDLSRRTFLASLAVSSGTLAFSGSAEATTVRGLDLSELVRASHRVLVGTALDARARFAQSGSGRRIVTDVRVRVEESWVGALPLPSEFVVKIYGGRIGSEAELVFGQPEFVNGERSLLFLMERASGRAVVTGMAQGQYRLLEDSGGDLVLTPPRGHLTIANRERSAVARLSGLAAGKARALVVAVRR